MQFRYNQEKNAMLIAKRGIGFEEIIEAIQQGNLLDITFHHNKAAYPHQKILHVRCLNQIYLVPYVEEEDRTFFLKTLYPSRKATKKWFGK